MNGKFLAVLIVVAALIAGAAMYWLQVYAYYKPVIFTAGKEISLTPINGDQAQNILVTDIEGIDAESSPLRFRACFNTVQSLLILTETYNIYDNPTPLVTPN